VAGDSLEFRVYRKRHLKSGDADVDADGQGRRLFGTALLVADLIEQPDGYVGDLRLVDAGGGHLGKLSVRVETEEQREFRAITESGHLAARQAHSLNEAQKRRDRESREARRFNEEAQERLRREAERVAAELAFRRSQDLQREILASVHLWPSGELVTQVVLLAGCTVEDLTQRAAKTAKLPACPVLRGAQETLLDPKAVLLDVGGSEPNCSFHAEVCPMILTASEDGVLKLWNATLGALELEIPKQEVAVRCAAVYPDLKWVAAGLENGTVKVFVVDAIMKVVAVADTLSQGHHGPVRSIAFSEDGRSLLTGGEDGLVKIWRLKDSQCIHTLEGHTAPVTSLTCSSDGRTVRTVAANRIQKDWEMGSGRCLSTIDLESESTPSFSISFDGNVFLTVAREKEVEIRSMQSGACLRCLSGHTAPITQATFLALRAPQAIAPETVRPARSTTAFSASRSTASLPSAAVTARRPSLSAGAALILGGSPKATLPGAVPAACLDVDGADNANERSHSVPPFCDRQQQQQPQGLAKSPSDGGASIGFGVVGRRGRRGVSTLKAGRPPMKAPVSS